MRNDVEEALRVLAEAQREAEWEAQENHARNNAELGREMQAKLLALSLLRNEVHAQVGVGRAGPPVELLDQDQVQARKRRILESGGFKV